MVEKFCGLGVVGGSWIEVSIVGAKNRKLLVAEAGCRCISNDALV